MVVSSRWSIVPTVYSYGRVHRVLKERGAEQKKERYAVVFDDGRVWHREDFGSPDKDLANVMDFVCRKATKSLQEVEPIETELHRDPTSEP
jgi:hypothetical protein